MNLQEYRRGIFLFNRGAFFDAHEVWEDVWRETEGLEKKFLQALIQVAVALHHYSTGNVAGARSVLERGCRNLRECPEEFGQINLAAFLDALGKWQVLLASGSEEPEIPKMEIRKMGILRMKILLMMRMIV